MKHPAVPVLQLINSTRSTADVFLMVSGWRALTVPFLFRIQFRIPNCIWSTCLLGLLQSVIFSQSLLVIHDLNTFLKSTGQLYCRISLPFYLSDTFLWLNSNYAFLARITQKRCCILQCLIIKRCMMLLCPSTDNIKLAHLANTVFARFLHYKVAIFVISK